MYNYCRAIFTHPLFITVLVFHLAGYCNAAPYDMVYNPANGHFYKLYLAPSGTIAYSAAVSLATSTFLNGKQGYLVTITSVSEWQFLIPQYYTKVYPWNNTYTGTPPTIYPSFWVGAMQPTGSLTWYWYATGRNSSTFYYNGACTDFCNWASQPTTSDMCMRVYMYNNYGPGIGTWKPANCSMQLEAYMVEYDDSDRCSAGYTLNATTGWCVDLDECAIGKCGTGYSCVNSLGSYTCTDINECTTSDACGPGYTCANTIGSFTCTDINECSLSPSVCSPGYTCSNTKGSFVCTDINECQGTGATTLCGAGIIGNANTCTNIPGSYYCSYPHYYIISKLNNFTLVNNGTNIVTNYQYNTTNNGTQHFIFTPEGYIVHYYTGQFVTLYSGDTSALQRVIALSKDPTKQKWAYNSTSLTIRVASGSTPGTVMDVFGANPDPYVPVIVFFPKSSTDPTVSNQQFTLQRG